MRNFFVWLAVISLFLMLAAPVTGYKFLFVLPFGSKSHKFSMDPIALELVKKGHQVTFMSITETIKDSPNLTNIVLSNAKAVGEAGTKSFFDAKATDTSFQVYFLKRLRDLATATYGEQVILDILRQPLDDAGNPKYDCLVVDAIFNDFMLPLAQRMAIPSVYISPAGLLPTIAWALNVPHPYSYIPSTGLTEVSDDIANFWSRFKNAYYNIGFIIYRYFFLWPVLNDVIREYYPEALPLAELEKNVSFMMINSHFSFSSQIPTMPYLVEVGGLNLNPAKELPQDLEDYMQSSGDHGIIYFSLGSVTKGDSMPLEMRAKVIETFGKLSQKILWKYEQDIEELPKNIKLTKWAPQQDILGHPKIRLFITHGGGMSTQEAAYHACPIIGFPLSADQHTNIGNAVTKGYAAFLDWRAFTVDELLYTINDIITDKRYKEAATKVSTMMRDRPQSPVETASYWLEYVVRHQGAPHLKSGAENLNFFQYFLLDIIGLVLLALLAILCILGYTLHKIFGYFGLSICPLAICSKICACSRAHKTIKPMHVKPKNKPKNQ